MENQQTIILDFPEGIIHFPVEKNNTPKLLWKIVYEILPVCDMLTSKGAAIATSFNQNISCKMGCGVCCCQMVPLSPPEAAIIADVVEHLPAARKKTVVASFALAQEKLLAAGLWDKISQMYSDQTDKDEVMDVNRQYFDVAIPCPFLLDGSCSIYPHRPSRCREYSVLTPSEYCANPFDTRIRRLPLTIRLCESLSHTWASVTKKPAIIIPLVKALDWVRENGTIRTLTVDNTIALTEAVLGHACKRANERAQERMKR